MADWLQTLQQDYVKKSEVRIVNDRLRFRMLPDVAKNYDKGMYNKTTDMWVDLVKEIDTLHIKYHDNGQPVFYIYFVPNDWFASMRGYEYSVGMPLECFDEDGFCEALYYIRKSLDNVKQNDKMNLFNRVIKLHELSHLIHREFGSRFRYCAEGFAEVVPWYILGYEKRIPTHLQWMRALPKIYTLQDFYDNKVPYFENIGNKIASYRTGYVSLYLMWRAIISNIATRFQMSPDKALQRFLDLWYDMQGENDRDFVVQATLLAGIDTDKLFNTIEYQQAVLNDIARDLAKPKQLQQGRTI